MLTRMPGEAVIYVRISRDRAGAGLGIARQEQDGRGLADRLGLTVRRVYADNDISAASGKHRPDYLAMLADLADSPAAVITWHTDRLHRRVAELEEYVAFAELHGIATYTVQAGELDLATPSGRLVARMLGAAAAYEIEHMKERHRAAKRQAAEKGEWRGGRRPFGYAEDGVTLVAAEADAIASGAAQVIAGMSLAAVARRWNAAGLTTGSGRAWRPNEAGRVLLRARNAALVEHRDPDSGENQVVGPASWPPVLTLDQWHQVRHVLTDPARRTTPGPERRWLLSGILTCGACGAKMAASTTAGKGRGTRPVYRCRAGGGRVHVARDCQAADDFVTGYVLTVLAEMDAAGKLLADDPDTRLVDSQIAAAERRLAEMEEEIRTVRNGARLIRQVWEPLDAELDAMRERRAKMIRPRSLSAFAGHDPAEVWDGMELSERHAIVAGLVEVSVKPAPKGRPAGWLKGQSYFDPRSVVVTLRE